MSEENKKLENLYSRKRTILKRIFIVLGIIFIMIGILVPIILFMMAGGMGWWLPLIFGVLYNYTPALVGLGIIFIFIGMILKKPTLWKKILLIIFIILSSPFIFKATAGTIVGHNSINKNTITIGGITEVSNTRLNEIIKTALTLEDANECKKLLPFYFLPSSLASRLLPSFWNPYPEVSITGLSRSMGPLYNIYSEGFTKCVAEVAKKKKDATVCEKFGPYEKRGCGGCSLSYPFNEYDCLYLVSQELIKEYEDSKYCDLLKDVWNPPCAIQDCLLEVAIKNKDFELCKRLKSEEGGWCPRREDYYKECTNELIKFFPELSAKYIEHIWKIYKNEEYKYEIKYPEGWISTGGASEYCPTKAEPGRKWCWDMYFYNMDDPKQEFFLYNPFSYAPTVESSMKLLKTELVKIKDSEYYLEKFFFTTKEDIEKENVLLVRWVKGGPEKSGAMIIYYKSETDENLKIFNQMLFTFRFLD